ncbi:MAG: sugar nucleotide-binding protein, partial [Candidatus Omnitrophica bacterium]|nr:sugar nucleotide-binding protein [Candidatus Omnitrophota bacterium]
MEKNKKILITGANGMLGGALLASLKRYDVSGTDKDDCDITDKSSLAKKITGVEFDAVVHCAAYTDVDGAEKNAKEAFLINEEGTRNLTETINKDCLFIYI